MGFFCSGQMYKLYLYLSFIAFIFVSYSMFNQLKRYKNIVDNFLYNYSNNIIIKSRYFIISFIVKIT